MKKLAKENVKVDNILIIAQNLRDENSFLFKAYEYTPERIVEEYRRTNIDSKINIYSSLMLLESIDWDQGNEDFYSELYDQVAYVPEDEEYFEIFRGG